MDTLNTYLAHMTFADNLNTVTTDRWMTSMSLEEVTRAWQSIYPGASTLCVERVVQS
jgi:hypothetical protein